MTEEQPAAAMQANVLPEHISRCWLNNGYHAHGAGPCFNTLDAALKYRDEYDKAREALMKFKDRHPWSWAHCPEWESFQNRWRA